MIIDPITSDIIKYCDTTIPILYNSILYILYPYNNTYLWADNFSEDLFKTEEYFWRKQIHNTCLEKKALSVHDTYYRDYKFISISSVKLSSNEIT